MENTEIPKEILELPWYEQAEIAFREAVKKAIAELLEMGLPVYTLRDDKVVDISAELRAAELRARHSAESGKKSAPGTPDQNSSDS